MKVKQLVAKIQGSLSKEANEVRGLLELESNIAINELKTLCEKHAADESELTEDTAAEFINYLNARWERIKNTDAIYLCHPETPANQICFLLAKELVALVDRSYFSLLMPTLKVTDVKQMGLRANDNTNLTDFVLTDDNCYLIHLRSCLTNAKQAGEKSLSEDKQDVILKLHYADERKLTENESRRVVNHSDTTSRYYIEMLKNKKSGDLSRLENQDNLDLFCYGELYNRRIFSYRKEGYNHLANNILSNFKSREALCQLFQVVDLCRLLNDKYIPFNSHNLDTRMGQLLMDAIEITHLRTLLLDGKDLATAVQDKSNYSGDPKHDRAMLYLYLALYQRELSARTSSYDSYTGFLTGYSKDQKEKSAKEVAEFLLSNKSLDAFTSTGNEQKSGKLGAIVCQMQAIAKPAYFEEPKKSSWFGY